MEGDWGCVEEWKVRTHAWFLRKVVWLRDRGICARCGKQCGRDGWIADHVVPLYRGGDGSLPNVQTLCVPCNKTKTAEDAALPKLEPGFQPRWLTYDEVCRAVRCPPGASMLFEQPAARRLLAEVLR
jgi:5-methylcytosine-specific restriction endonuclease McrA